MARNESFIHKLKMFDPHKSFIELPVVWLFIFIIFVLALLCGLLIAANTPLVLSFSSDGFNYFLSSFRFPLGILALIIPIVALLAANHRSEQTKEQIRVTNMQNVFSNHYKHIEEFKKYIDGLKINSMNDVRIRKLHKKMFPRSFEGIHSIDSGLANEFAEGCEYILQYLNMPSDKLNATLAVNRIDYLMAFFGIVENRNTPEMTFDVAVKYVKSQLTDLYAIFVFSHDCPEYVHTAANRCLAQAGNPTYINS
ncbi:hypothetical protein H9W03_002885 [Vibrio parahaemolyticus]|nr:hypothetical protein [Vibrio parahaemolyticus]HCH5087859.1 hypothetical protein [Vibrio parahaemolyticus]